MAVFNFCLVSSDTLPFGDKRVGVGGVTVISGGNFATDDGMKSFGMFGGTRDFIRLPSPLQVWDAEVVEGSLTELEV